MNALPQERFKARRIVRRARSHVPDDPPVSPARGHESYQADDRDAPSPHDTQQESDSTCDLAHGQEETGARRTDCGLPREHRHEFVTLDHGHAVVVCQLPRCRGKQQIRDDHGLARPVVGLGPDDLVDGLDPDAVVPALCLDDGARPVVFEDEIRAEVAGRPRRRTR